MRAKSSAVTPYSSETIGRARELGERHTERHAWLVRSQVQLWTRPDEIDYTETRHEAEESVRVVQEGGDDLVLARAWAFLWVLYQSTGEASTTASNSRAGARARQESGQPSGRELEPRLARPVAGRRTDPVAEGIQRLEELLQMAQSDPFSEAAINSYLALLVAMQGRFEEARALNSPQPGSERRPGADPLSNGPREDRRARRDLGGQPRRQRAGGPRRGGVRNPAPGDVGIQSPRLSTSRARSPTRADLWRRCRSSTRASNIRLRPAGTERLPGDQQSGRSPSRSSDGSSRPRLLLEKPFIAHRERSFLATTRTRPWRWPR